MKSSIQPWLFPSVFEGDEEKTRQAKLLHTMITAGLVYLGVLIPVFWFSGVRSSVIIINTLFFMSLLIMRSMLRHGRVVVVGHGALTLSFTWVTMLAISQGTIRTPSTATYLSIVILAGFFLGLRGVLVSSIASSLAVLGLILAQNAGLLPQPDYNVSYIQWLTYTCLFGITGVLSLYANQTIQLALKRAEKEIIERKQSQNALKKSETLYRLLAENISDVIWILNLSTGTFRYMSPSVERLRGYTMEEVMTQNMDIALTPASMESLQAKLPGRIEAFQQGQHVFYVDELEQPCKDGTTVWTETTTNFQVNEVNGQLEVYGLSRDITERKRNEAILQLRLELLECAANQSLGELMQTALDKITLFTESPIGFYHFVEPDEKTLTLQAWSTRTLKEFCKAEGKGMHYNVEAAGVWVECIRLRKPVIHNDYKSLPAPRRKGLPAGHAEVVRELVVPVYRGNRVVSILGIGNKSSDYNERDVEVVSYLADVVWEIVKRKQAEENLQQAHEHLSLQLAEIEQLKDELQEQAIRDPLTGLFNRRYLDETITREIKRAERENDSLSVIIADIDHFKLTNDTHGHQTGDKFLTKIASLMMTNARISDIVCRYGGEEFLLVMPGTDLASAVKRAEEMRQLCAGIIIPHEGNELSVTLSFGVATYPVHGENADVITVKADKALYSSKARGRNCVTAWNFDSHAEI